MQELTSGPKTSLKPVCSTFCLFTCTQVLSAKVVAKAHSKARFGYVTLATPEQAQKCIGELSGTELKGNTIHVELVS